MAVNGEWALIVGLINAGFEYWINTIWKTNGVPFLFHVLIFFILISVNHLLQGFPLLLPSTRATRASTTTTAIAAATPDAKIGHERMQSSQHYVWLKSTRNAVSLNNYWWQTHPPPPPPPPPPHPAALPLFPFWQLDCSEQGMRIGRILILQFWADFNVTWQYPHLLQNGADATQSWFELHWPPPPPGPGNEHKI